MNIVHISGIVFICIILQSFSIINAQLIWERLDTKHDATHSPLPRRDASLGFDSARNQLILFGGRSGNPPNYVALNDTWIYSITTREWRQVPTNRCPPARYGHVSGVGGDFFYVTTGRGHNGGFYNDIWRFDLRAEKWVELQPQQKPDYYTALQWNIAKYKESFQPSPRYGAAGGIFPNSSRFYLHAGFSKQAHGDTFSYSIMDSSWYLETSHPTPYDPTSPHARYGHAATMLSDHELLIYGGCLSGGGTGGSCPSNDAWIYNAKQREWTQIEGCASARHHATLALFPIRHGQRKAILFGGQEESTQILITVPSPANQLAIFNPDSMEWSLKASEGQVPTKRASVAMATGEMGVYMFGGVELSSGNLLNDLYLLHGDAHAADRARTHAQCNPTFFNLVMLHGILMALGCGFFVQWGAFIARYWPRGSRWALGYRLHVLFQLFGLVLTAAGFVTGVISVRSTHFSFSHGIIGLVVMVTALLQPINAFVRIKLLKNTNEESKLHSAWKCIHHLLGYTILVLSLVNISLGLFLAHARPIIWITWYIYMGVIVFIRVAAEVRLQRKRSRQMKNECFTSSTGYKYLLRTRSGLGETPRDRSFTKSVHDNPALVH